MDVEAFVAQLDRLTVDELDVLRSSVGPAHDTVADEIDEWRTVLALDDALRRSRRSRDAARAAYAASHAVQRSARRGGIELPDDGVTRVARAAADLARAMVAGDHVAALVMARHNWHPVFLPTA